MEELNTITTKSLLLRPIKIEDASLMFAAISQDPEVARYMSWRLTGNFEDTLSFVKLAVNWWAKPETANDFVFAIFLANSQEFIGSCSTGPHSPSEKFHWGIGYNIARRFWGKGYGTEAVAAITQYTLARPEVYRASAVVDLENVASARILEKCGFAREGILKRYSILPNVSDEPRDVFIYGKTK